MTGPPGGTLPPEIAADVLRIQSQAAQLPSPGEVRALAEQAVRHGGTDRMSLNEIRDLAATAVRQADEVAGLLYRLRSLLPPAGDGR